jgi:hypothetical protein
MSAWAGVGESRQRDARAAGREAAQAALAGRGDADLILCFATVGYDLGELLAGVRGETGEVPLAGCSGAGVIGPSGSDEGAFAVAVLAVRLPGARFTVEVAEKASGDIEGAAEHLAAKIAAAGSRLCFLFPDGLKANTQALLRALDRRLEGRTAFLGGTAGEVMQFTHTYQFAGERVLEDAVVALVVSGDYDHQFVVTHGCDPLGIEHTITRAEGGKVAEIDGRPAWDVLADYLDGPTGPGLSAASVPYLCVAERLPEGAVDEYAEHIIRVPLGRDDATGALFFPGELVQGERVVMARRNLDKVCANAEGAARRLLASRPRLPTLILQFDCAGRGATLFGRHTTEKLIAPMQRVFPPSVPWIGFHSYGEIAPVGGRNYYHNYTVALCAFYEPEASGR